MFINEENKLKAGWAVLLGVVIFYVLGITLTINLVNITFFQQNLWALKFLQKVVMLILSVLLSWVILKENIINLGLNKWNRWQKNAILGVMLGAMITCFLFIGAIFFESCTMLNDLDAPRYTIELLFGIIFWLVIAIAEEFFFRAYMMNALKRLESPVAIVLIAAMVYTFFGVGGVGATLISNCSVAVFGALLCYMYYKTESLWLTIGFNFGWQYMGNTIFSLKNNGVYNLQIAKEGLINGGIKGPQYGIIALILLCICFLFINIYVYNLNKIEEGEKAMLRKKRKILEEVKEKKEKDEIKCHEDVYDDVYDDVMPIDDMDDRESADFDSDDRD